MYFSLIKEMEAGNGSIYEKKYFALVFRFLRLTTVRPLLFLNEPIPGLFFIYFRLFKQPFQFYNILM